MDEIIQLKDQFYVLATSWLADRPLRVLRYGELFAVFDAYGNLQPVGHSAQGLFAGSTRHLSLLELRLDGVRPRLLSSAVRRDNTLFTTDLMNAGGPGALPGSLHVFRAKFLWGGRFFERVRLSNFGGHAVETELSLRFAADFMDIFEMRGAVRARQGERFPPRLLEDREVRLEYRGADGVPRVSRVVFEPAPARLEPGEATYRLRLERGEQRTVNVTVDCDGPSGDADVPYPNAFSRLCRERRAERHGDCRIVTSSGPLNDWLERSQADLHMMITRTAYGPYPYAGIPLFNTVFGRDGLITAMQTLWVNPRIARGVLAYLAATQSNADEPAFDAEPGKILHEVRTGEMVATGEVPFARYYGSVDATPLFVVLAGMYLEATGDRELIDSIRPGIEAALEWIDRYGDLDGDGFVEYRRRSRNGLENQAWKDSGDSVFHDDGAPAEGPIAFCEVQGYVHEAKMRAAALMRAWGEGARADGLVAEAARLQQRFEERFWCEDLHCYAMALDGRKKPCRVRSSNAGQALFGGIARPARAAQVASLLVGDRMFSGWGVRTLDAREVRFNPMSYHNGSVWPHDNSLIAEGLARYGLKEPIRRIFAGMFAVAQFADLQRLPELFCGFNRRIGEGPTLYPAACSPQGWAAGAAFLLLKAMLGLSIDGEKGTVRFVSPELPESVEWIRILGLPVGGSRADLLLQQSAGDVAINVIRRTGRIEVVVAK